MNLKPRIKKCDKCNRRSCKKRVVKRFCFMTHFPYYNYEGFDLCQDCEKKLDYVLNKFFVVKK